MPTYICRAPSGLLNDGSKSDLAAAITKIHSQVTGAEELFVQIFFHEITPGDCFIAGKPLSSTHCFIQGHIRAGRSAIERGELIAKMAPVACEILGIPRYAVWIYVNELPARAMCEFGHILPEPGDEAGWFTRLPDEDRKRLQSL